MNSDHLMGRGFRRGMTPEQVERSRLQVERSRLQVLRNDAAWIREQMTSGKAVNAVYMIPHDRLMRVVCFMEAELKLKLGPHYIIG